MMSSPGDPEEWRKLQRGRSQTGRRSTRWSLLTDGEGNTFSQSLFISIFFPTFFLGGVFNLRISNSTQRRLRPNRLVKICRRFEASWLSSCAPAAGCEAASLWSFELRLVSPQQRGGAEAASDLGGTCTVLTTCTPISFSLSPFLSAGSLPLLRPSYSFFSEKPAVQRKNKG